MKSTALISLTAVFALNIYMANGKTPAQYVNPFIGTSNYGTTQPGPVVPGGMVSMSPFNTIPRAEHKVHTDSWCSTPYVYDNTWCIGFTQVNLSGVGCPDFGALLLMPTQGELEVDFNKYAAKLYDQTASAGYYSCRIGDQRILAEMSTTRRSTISRYTFNAGRSNILFNIGRALSTESGCYVRRVSDNQIEGFRLVGDFCYGRPQSVVPLYFSVRLSKTPAQTAYWKRQPPLAKALESWSQYSDKYKIYQEYKGPLAGDDIGVAFTFDTYQGEQIQVSVGISYVSQQNAQENLETEQGLEPDFELIHNSAENQWNEVLQVVDLQGGTDDQKTQFYTSLYHNWIHPNTLSDVNGQYPAMGSGETMSIKSDSSAIDDLNIYERLTMFSGWDVYRISPFVGALFFPERQALMARNLMQMYRENGALPKFEIASQDFMVMEGDPAIPYLTACYYLGLTKHINTDELYQAMLKNATNATYVRDNQDFYNQNHYIPLTSKYDNSVSQAIEYYIADWALAQMAKTLGHSGDYQMLMARAMGYKHYFDKSYGLLRPKLPNGEFMEGFNPLEGENFEPSNGFHEGTSWNYSFSIPYDINGLIKLFGKPSRFVDSLQACFVKGYFDMSNEPDMSYPYFFTYVKGSEWRTQYWVNDCLTKYYSNTPGGLPGNDDAGTMSSWQMLSMLGIYPPCPARPDYIISTPTFDKVTIHLDKRYYPNNELVIQAVNRTPENIYIEKIELDNKPYKSYFITHNTLLNAKKLTVYCTNKPQN